MSEVDFKLETNKIFADWVMRVKAYHAAKAEVLEAAKVLGALHGFTLRESEGIAVTLWERIAENHALDISDIPGHIRNMYAAEESDDRKNPYLPPTNLDAYNKGLKNIFASELLGSIGKPTHQTPISEEDE